ncbi:MAG TPA: inorganic phosphate transporter [Gemmataceae bacterium]|nr:inorganic phosphate transporter [Gemmataceae bacterium]
MTIAVILIAALCLAYANGANDNFKGVATLFGSGTVRYRGALLWATITTLVGSLTAIWLAEKLLSSFSGRGLVSETLTADSRYPAAVALGAGLTVLLATRLEMPISTTHGLVGALIGAGWTAGSAIDLSCLGGQFFLPLLVSPVVAIGLTIVCYASLHIARVRLGVTETTCFCVGKETVEVVPVLTETVALQRVEVLTASFGTPVSCRKRYDGTLLGMHVSVVLDWLHYLSAGVVSYARGLNDTPKIAAVLLVADVSGAGAIGLIAVAIACGGLGHARRVAETMSHRITPLSHGQGLTANLLTGLIVVGASRLGLPVSTTHVSCGAMFGIGAVTRRARWGVIGKIVAAWLTTLPAGAALGAASYWLLRAI